MMYKELSSVETINNAEMTRVIGGQGLNEFCQSTFEQGCGEHISSGCLAQTSVHANSDNASNGLGNCPIVNGIADELGTNVGGVISLGARGQLS